MSTQPQLQREERTPIVSDDFLNYLTVFKWSSQARSEPVNAARISRNQALQARRVPRPSIPRPSSSSSHWLPHQWIAAYALLSPGSKALAAKAFEVMKPTPPAPSSTPKTIFSASREVSGSTFFDSTYGLGTHSTIIDLANARQHIPLTIFTNDATKRLQEGHSLKKVKSTINGVAHHLLDLSLFPAEDKMDALTWQEAWRHYLTWLQDVCDAEVYLRWSWHYTTLSQDPDLHDNFDSILLFDIDMRSTYASRPSPLVVSTWQAQLNADRSSSHRFEPYNKNLRCNCDVHESSFPDNNSNNSRVKSDPTCLICQHSGHCFSDCQEETTAKGKQTFAKYANGQLFRHSNGSPLCVTFNLNSSKKSCKNFHASSQHACSFCRDTDPLKAALSWRP
ncbi:hypothetical protein V8E55_008939 [Tylopilus felleus]